MILKNKKTVVVGLGKSGISVARFLKRRGAHVTVTDMLPEEELKKGVALELKELEIPMDLGFHDVKKFLNADFIVLSPGVPHTIPPVKKAAEKEIPVMGEIELASRFIDEPIVAVTGTNGKTTTTTIIGEMIKESGLDVFVGGNIGTPLIDYVEQEKKADVVVVELSSFQLDTIIELRPKVSVLLNITEDHLDRYKDINAYARSKGRIFENQHEEDIAVINKDDEFVKGIGGILRNKIYSFGGDDGGNGAKIFPEKIEFNVEGVGKYSLDTTKINLFGKHNFENIASAALATIGIGGSYKGIQEALNKFAGLPHRIEYIDRIKGVRFFNDSKATNTDAVIRALSAFNNIRVVLIIGGRDKNMDFSLLKDSVKKHARKLILIGETKDKIKKALGNSADMVNAKSMRDAVNKAYKAAGPEDVVLLSPSCASFDMFNSYIHRGEEFAKSVQKLKEAMNGK